MSGEYLLDPAPTAGCPIGDTGWKVIVDAWYNAAAGSRVYGSSLYGNGVYGDTGGAGISSWVDLSESVTGTVVTRGTQDGAQRVPVDRIEFDVVDEDGSLWDINPAAFYAIRAGVPIRVGLRDPFGVYSPLATGRIDRIDDRHDVPPRVLSVSGYGMITDLVVDRIDIQRPAETAGARATYFLGLAPWTWTPIPPASSVPATYTLAADAAVTKQEIRAAIDRVGRSVGLFQSTDRRGAWRAEQWPIVARPGVPITVTDCMIRGGPFSGEFSPAFDHRVDSPAGDLQTAAIGFVEDRAALLNVVQMTNQGTPATSYSVQDDQSMALHGVASNTYGFPWTGLAYTTVADITPIATRIFNRFRNVTFRVESMEWDTLQDNRWFPAVAALDIGSPVTINRDEVAPRTFDTIVTGYVLRIDRDRIQGTANLQPIGA